MKDVVRRINYFTAGFVSLLGISLTGEIFQEDDMPDKIDDILMLLVSLGAIWWYKKRGYKLTSGVEAMLFVAVSLVIKIGAIIIEHADQEAVGDDIGISIALFLAFIFVVWQVLSLRKAK